MIISVHDKLARRLWYTSDDNRYPPTLFSNNQYFMPTASTRHKDHGPCVSHKTTYHETISLGPITSDGLVPKVHCCPAWCIEKYGLNHICARCKSTPGTHSSRLERDDHTGTRVAPSAKLHQINYNTAQHTVLLSVPLVRDDVFVCG